MALGSIRSGLYRPHIERSNSLHASKSNCGVAVDIRYFSLPAREISEAAAAQANSP